jgi:hypothetical protein
MRLRRGARKTSVFLVPWPWRFQEGIGMENLAALSIYYD